jgi:hypothetical protein
MCYFYYVISAFPPIMLGQKSEMTYEEARQTVILNVRPFDWEQVVLLQRLVDIRNIRALWCREPFDPRGNLKENELSEALLLGGDLPDFVLAYMNRYETPEDRLRYFPSLVASFYRETIGHLKGFLRHYYQVEREIRLCLTALRAKSFQRDLLRELQFEDPTDPFVAQLIAQKDEKETVLPEEYEDLKRVFLENKSEPKKLYRAILQIRFSAIEDLEAGQPFAIDQVLGYLARLSIVEAWEQLDEQKGRAVLQEVCR